jgi:hypothetical protein
MKYLLVIFAVMIGSAARAATVDDAAVKEIMDKYAPVYERAKGSCQSLPEQLKSVKIMAGVGIGAGVVGLAGGATGATAGLLKAGTDSLMTKLETDYSGIEVSDEVVNKFQELAKMPAEELIKQIREDQKLKEILQNYKKYSDETEEGAKREILGKIVNDAKLYATAKKMSDGLGNIRTAGSFVGGAGGVGGAVAGFGGAAKLDDLIVAMETCATETKKIEDLKMELTFADPGNPALAEMTKIAENCRGLNTKNIEDIRAKFKTAGIISIVGAATGIAGGVASMAAKDKDKENRGNNTNTASTVLSGVSGAAGGVTAVLSGIVLSGLNKNSEIADKCTSAFGNN